MLVHIPIPVREASGRWVGPEMVEARPLDGGVFEVLCPPRFAEGLAVGDLISLDTTPRGFRTIRHGRNLTIWIFAEQQDQVVELASRSRAAAKSIDVTVEGTPPRMVIITAALRVGWTTIEASMNSIVDGIDGARWYYGNVYDPETGAPLNWWLQTDSNGLDPQST